MATSMTAPFVLTTESLLPTSRVQTSFEVDSPMAGAIDVSFTSASRVQVSSPLPRVSSTIGVGKACRRLDCSVILAVDSSLLLSALTSILRASKLPSSLIRSASILMLSSLSSVLSESMTSFSSINKLVTRTFFLPTNRIVARSTIISKALQNNTTTKNPTPTYNIEVDSIGMGDRASCTPANDNPPSPAGQLVKRKQVLSSFLF